MTTRCMLTDFISEPPRLHQIECRVSINYCTAHTWQNTEYVGQTFQSAFYIWMADWKVCPTSESNLTVIEKKPQEYWDFPAAGYWVGD